MSDPVRYYPVAGRQMMSERAMHMFRGGGIPGALKSMHDTVMGQLEREAGLENLEDVTVTVHIQARVTEESWRRHQDEHAEQLP